MAIAMSFDELPTTVREQLNRTDEPVIVVENSRPVAEIRPLPKTRTVEDLIAAFERLPHLTPEEAEAFGRDIDEAREAADRIPVRDPWED
jgi:antitoxin (DNA-binding transcriptional repressor) of toxin-antitoxin stability system